MNLLCHSNNFCKAPLKSSCVSVSSPQLSHNHSLWAERIAKSHREQGLEGDELSWCPSWSNSLWQGWSCGLMHCPGGKVTDQIWRVLASSDGISSWTPLKPQHGIPCWLSVQWEPSACRSCQFCQKKRIIKSLRVDLLCLAFLGLREPACFHWELCLLVSGS